MNIFISWSENESEKAAKALKEWLPEVLPVADPWISQDIPSGKNPLVEISRALKEARYGIICITSNNMGNPWIIYEASALYNNGIDVCPFVIDLTLRKRRLPEPLTHMQAKTADFDGTLQLVLDINIALGSPVKDEQLLKKVVRSKWKKLEKKLKRIRDEGFPKPKDYEKIFEDFVGIFLDFYRHRSALNFSSQVEVTIDLMAKNKYRRRTVHARALKAIDENRELFNRKSILVGNVCGFLKEHFTDDDLTDVISRLEPILRRKIARKEKRDMLMRRIELEKLEVFLRFHKILVDKLTDQLS